MRMNGRHIAKKAVMALALAGAFAIGQGAALADERSGGPGNMQQAREAAAGFDPLRPDASQPDGPTAIRRAEASPSKGRQQASRPPAAKPSKGQPAAHGPSQRPAASSAVKHQPADRRYDGRPDNNRRYDDRRYDNRRYTDRNVGVHHYKGPRHGGYVPALPRGHVRVPHRGMDYYYANGYFHQRRDNGYVIVQAPLGAVTVSLPIGFRTFILGGLTYYFLNDIYYRHVSAGYEVVAPPPDAPIYVDQSDSADDRGILPGDMVRVVSPRLNVRTGPGREYPIVEVLANNSILKVESGVPDWLFIKLPNGRSGWIMEQFVVLEQAGASG